MINAPPGHSQLPVNRLRGRRLAAGVWLVGFILLSAAAGCGSNTGKDVPQLVEDLRQTDAGARYTAVKSLGNRAADAKEAVPAMVAMLKDSDSAVRVGAAYALGKVGPAASSAVPALIAALDDRHKDVRQAAAYSLPALGPDAAAAWKALQKVAAQDLDPSVRNEAAKSLAKIEMVYKYRHATDGRTTAQAQGGRP